MDALHHHAGQVKIRVGKIPDSGHAVGCQNRRHLPGPVSGQGQRCDIHPVVFQKLFQRVRHHNGNAPHGHTGQDGITMAEFPGLPVALPSDGIPLSRVILSCYEETGVAPNVLLNTAYPQIFRALYFQGTAAFFATGMILSDHLRNRPAGVPPLHAFPLLLNGDFIKREITLLTNRHRYLSKPAQHFISLTQAFFAAIELERIWLPDTKLNISGLN